MTYMRLEIVVERVCSHLVSLIIKLFILHRKTAWSYHVAHIATHFILASNLLI